MGTWGYALKKDDCILTVTIHDAKFCNNGKWRTVTDEANMVYLYARVTGDIYGLVSPSCGLSFWMILAALRRNLFRAMTNPTRPARATRSRERAAPTKPRM